MQTQEPRSRLEPPEVVLLEKRKDEGELDQLWKDESERLFFDLDLPRTRQVTLWPQFLSDGRESSKRSGTGGI